jgi:hypothetical protein
MFIPEDLTFSASYDLNHNKNYRNTAQEYRYSLNTLLGINKVHKQGIPIPFEINAIYARFIKDCNRPYVDPANVGMTLWVAGELGMTIHKSLRLRVDSLMENPDGWNNWTSQDFGWMITGLVASKDPSYLDGAQQLLDYVIRFLYIESTHLFKFCTKGWRRNQSSFGGLCYLIHAFLHHAKMTGNGSSESIGLAACRSIVELQGPQGQWPWVLNVQKGTVSDWYQVYSVHQDAMAGLFLTLAVDLGHVEFRIAIEKGFRWILGENEMNQPLLVPSQGMINRSLVRKSPLERPVRLGRMLTSEWIGRKDNLATAPALRIDRECRSYHLGWMLYVFSGRDDYNALINHKAFAM